MNILKFKSSKADSNLGFSSKEILSLMNTVNERLPKTYVKFLIKAGKRSNVLNFGIKEMDDLIALQKEFKSEVEKSDFFDDNKNVWCFWKSDINTYHYFEFNSKNNPMVLCFEKSYVMINNGWTKKYGPISKKGSFVNFLNWRTEEKWGISTYDKFLNLVQFIILLPIGLPFLVLLWLQTKANN